MSSFLSDWLLFTETNINTLCNRFIIHFCLNHKLKSTEVFKHLTFRQLNIHKKMKITKDSGWFCWLAAAFSWISILLMGMSTGGNVSVLVYIWTEKFDISTEEVVWAPSLLNVTALLVGEYIIYYIWCFRLELLA